MYYGTVRKQNSVNLITKALFLLLEEKKFSKITVTEIVTEAKIARATYYRNFYYKEEIIDNYIENLHIQLENRQKQITKITPPFNEDELIRILDQAFLTAELNKKNLLLLYSNGFSNKLLSLFNKYTSNVFIKELQRNTINKYHVSIIAGGIFNIMMEWLQNDTTESSHYMAKETVRILNMASL